MQLTHLELRNRDESRRFLLHGLWLQRVQRPEAKTVRSVLEWALELTCDAHPLPPLGLVADVGRLVLRPEGPPQAVAGNFPGMPAGLLRAYEDHVLGKFYSDRTFERASDAIRRFSPGRNQTRGLAFLLAQFQRQAGFDAVLLSPAFIKRLLEAPAEEALAHAWQDLAAGNLHPLLPRLYESLIAVCQRTSTVLSSADLFELEHGTALIEMGPRIALRQVLQAAEFLEGRLHLRPPSSPTQRCEIATSIPDEDDYPVGGYASLSNRGTIESLLHSQLGACPSIAN